MKIPQRLASWADSVANLWASYWLPTIGSFLVLGSVLLKWVEFPFSRNLTGLQLSLLHSSGLIPHVSIMSFGALGVLALFAGLITLRFFAPALCLVGAILITLWVLTPAQLAFRQPMMLSRLVDELEVTPEIKIFTKDYLAQNYGPAEDVPKHLVLDSAWGRFVAAWSFLRLGWYCFGIGSTLILIYGIGCLPDGKAMTSLTVLWLPVGALAIVLAPPLIAQYYFHKGSVAKARGRNQEAITDYQKAIKWDAWHAQDIGLYATIGQLQKLAGIATGSPERHLTQAMELRDDNEYEPAIFEFTRAAEAGGALGAAARRASAQTWVDFGLALYTAGGIGSAVTSWQQALADDPTQAYALFYLARGYYNIGEYQASVQAIERLAKIISGHDSMLGSIYALAGDSYAKLGRDADARHYYNLSLSADSTQNYWALTGLIGE